MGPFTFGEDLCYKKKKWNCKESQLLFSTDLNCTLGCMNINKRKTSLKLSQEARRGSPHTVALEVIAGSVVNARPQHKNPPGK